MTVTAPPRLLVRTREVPAHDDELLSLLPLSTPLRDVACWIREGDGVLGWGRAASCMTSGPGRFEAAQDWWRWVTAEAEVLDEVKLPGTGLLMFGSFSFAAESPAGGTLVVPEVVVGRRAGRCWMTTVGADDLPAGPPSSPSPAWGLGGSDAATRDGGVRLRDGAVAAAEWPAVVSAALARIDAGEVDKVVLARDVIAESGAPLDVSLMLARLAARYGATWTFAVDGLIGATPEMLVRLLDGVVRSRVLAGTLRRDTTPAPLVTEAHPDLADRHTSDPALRLISSDKDLDEHAFAVRSVADALAPHCTDLEVPDEPFVLALPDVLHLASDLFGTPLPGASSLALAAALHPSAAVCGTPADAAARVIAELEPMDRGRYAGPVGWMDASGDGDWGIALRCGQLADDGTTMRLFAGGGIVAASDPEAELAETEAKLAAMRHALGV